MKEIFDNYVETSFDGLEQAYFKFHQFKLNYLKYFPKDVSSKVLDIGIGRGEMLTCMRDWDYAYHGVDISPSTVKFCQSIQLSCEVTDDTSSWLQARGEEYALITCLDVLEHVPRDQTIQFLRSIRHSLVAGGVAIIQVPNLQSPYGYLHHFNDFTHVSGFVEHSLAQVLMAAGFKKFEMHGFEEIYLKTFKQNIVKVLRWGFRNIVRFLRKINSNPNPNILDPILYVVAYK